MKSIYHIYALTSAQVTLTADSRHPFPLDDPNRMNDMISSRFDCPDMTDAAETTFYSLAEAEAAWNEISPSAVHAHEFDHKRNGPVVTVYADYYEFVKEDLDVDGETEGFYTIATKLSEYVTDSRYYILRDLEGYGNAYPVCVDRAEAEELMRGWYATDANAPDFDDVWRVADRDDVARYGVSVTD